MSLLQLFALLALGGLAWYWLDGIKAREAGVAAARRACQREGLQLLDETVVGRRLRLARNDSGHLVLRRAYDFEYSLSGNDRYRGAVVLEGQDVVLIDLAAHRPPAADPRSLH